MLLPVILPGEDVAMYVTVPLPIYVEGVNETDADPEPADAEPIVGVVGFFPPEAELPTTRIRRSNLLKQPKYLWLALLKYKTTIVCVVLTQVFR